MRWWWWISAVSPYPSRPRNTVAPAILNSRQRFTMASYRGFPWYRSLSPKWRRRSLAFLTVRMRRLRWRAAVNQANHLHVGKNNDSVLHHRLNLVYSLGQLLLRVHNRNHHRQVVREQKPPTLVGVALHSVSQNAPVHRCPGNIHQAQTLDNRLIKGFPLPLVRLAHIDTHQPGCASHFGMRPLRRRGAFRAGNFDHIRILHLDHAIGNHVVESGHDLIDFPGGFDELDANWQVLREHLDFHCVHRLVGAETGHRTRGGSPGHPFVKQQRQNGVAQGAKVVLRVLVDKNRDLLCRALLEHTNSSRGRQAGPTSTRARPLRTQAYRSKRRGASRSGGAPSRTASTPGLPGVDA